MEYDAAYDGIYDAVVVGAGPAGASAAYWLGEAGKRVLLPTHSKEEEIC
jgi:flavin-dependent dehydrogenase